MTNIAINERDRTALQHTIATDPWSVPRTLKRLVEEGHNPLALDDERNTLCHSAILTGRPNQDTLEAILEFGVDINQPNYATRTPLHISVSLGPFEPLSGHVRNWVRWIISRA